MVFMSVNRPTSPHLSIYKPQISSVLSIFHRFTGMALYAGLVVVTVWLFVAAYQPEQYAALHDLLTSFLGRLLLIVWTAAFYYHLGNGIRHLFWDIGKGFELATMAKSGWAVLFFAAAMTAISWVYILQ